MRAVLHKQLTKHGGPAQPSLGLGAAISIVIWWKLVSRRRHQLQLKTGAVFAVFIQRSQDWPCLDRRGVAA